MYFVGMYRMLYVLAALWHNKWLLFRCADSFKKQTREFHCHRTLVL